MKLHLIRHAKAEKPSGQSDISRNLAEKGIKQSIGLSEYLKDKLSNTIVWCSDANRTRETLKYISKNNDFNSIHYKIDLYLCSKETMLEQIWNTSADKDIVIIGHNFGISDLANYFTKELLLMQTGSYICIDFGNLMLKESSINTGRIVDQFRFESF